jgi:hypothetical protein
MAEAASMPTPAIAAMDGRKAFEDGGCPSGELAAGGANVARCWSAAVCRRVLGSDCPSMTSDAAT